MASKPDRSSPYLPTPLLKRAQENNAPLKRKKWSFLSPCESSHFGLQSHLNRLRITSALIHEVGLSVNLPDGFKDDTKNYLDHERAVTTIVVFPSIENAEQIATAEKVYAEVTAIEQDSDDDDGASLQTFALLVSDSRHVGDDFDPFLDPDEDLP